MAKAAPSCDQNTVLRFLVEAQGPQSLDAICEAMLGKVYAVGTQPRRLLRAIVGRLVSAGHVDRLERINGVLHNQGPATFQPTNQGRAFVKAGKAITSGANGPRTGIPKKSAGMRQRLWDAMVVLERASLPDLVEAARRESDPPLVKVTDNARKYFRALARAGIVKRLSRREPGSAPSSNGFQRFALLQNLGPKAPLTGKTFVTDPNADSSDAARIPYQVEKLPPASKRKAPCV